MIMSVQGIYTTNEEPSVIPWHVFEHQYLQYLSGYRVPRSLTTWYLLGKYS